MQLQDRVQPRPGLAGELHLDRKPRRVTQRHQVRSVTRAFEAVAILPVQLTRPLGTAQHLPLTKELRPRTVSHAAVHAHAESCAHHVGAGVDAGSTAPRASGRPFASPETANPHPTSSDTAQASPLAPTDERDSSPPPHSTPSHTATDPTATAHTEPATSGQPSTPVQDAAPDPPPTPSLPSRHLPATARARQQPASAPEQHRPAECA